MTFNFKIADQIFTALNIRPFPILWAKNTPTFDGESFSNTVHSIALASTKSTLLLRTWHIKGVKIYARNGVELEINSFSVI